jgi:hypothetical protein
MKVGELVCNEKNHLGKSYVSLKYIDIPPVTICIDGCPINDTQPENYLVKEFDTYA